MPSYVTERFWSRVSLNPNGCWEWTTPGPRGYGRFKANNKNNLAHRFSWELNVGPIPLGLHVLHRCDNPPCIRPSHLFLGTQQDNIVDMVAKGRGLSQVHQKAIRHPRGDDHWTHQHPERIRRGSRHGKSKLTDDDVREIRRLRAAGVTYRVISTQFGISDGTIGFIVNRTTWQHVKD